MKINPFRKFVVYAVLSSLTLIMPLSSLTVFAQTDPDAVEPEDLGEEELVSGLQYPKVEPSALPAIPTTSDLEAPLTRTFISNSSDDIVYTPDEATPASASTSALSVVIDNNFLAAYDDEGVVFLNDAELQARYDSFEESNEEQPTSQTDTRAFAQIQSFTPLDEHADGTDADQFPPENSQDPALLGSGGKTREDKPRIEGIEVGEPGDGLGDETGSDLDDTGNDGSLPSSVAKTTAEEEGQRFIKKAFPNLARANLELQERLNPLTTFERRLVFKHSKDLVAITGENNGDCANWNIQQDNEFINGPRNEDQYCDPPRVDVRVILALDYLLKPRSQGGAGREFLKIETLTQFGEKGKEEQNRPEPILNDNGDGEFQPNTEEEFIDTNGNGKWDRNLESTVSPHYIDLTSRDFRTRELNGRQVPLAFNKASHAVSQAIDISEIDRIRTTTRIRKTGLFGSSNNFKFQKPVNIKVAWQSDDGIAAEPLPDIAIHELLQDLSFNSIFELLDSEEILGEFNFEGRTLDSLSTEDLAKFVGGQLLGTLLDGQNISQFNFGDTLKDFGAIVLGGALNVDPQAIKEAKSLADIEEFSGRQSVAKEIGLDRMPEGNNQDELLINIGKQRLADLLGVKGYVFDNYGSVTEFKERLGWGLIEERLPVPEKSFSSNNINDVKNAVGESRFNAVFDARNAEIIDERLRLPTNTALRFINSGNVAEFKNAVGQKVWDSQLGLYSVESSNPQADYMPIDPLYIANQLSSGVNGGGAGQTGTLTLVSQYLRDAGRGDMADTVQRLAGQIQQKGGQANAGITNIRGGNNANPENNRNARNSFLSAVSSDISELEAVKNSIELAIASINVSDNLIVPTNNLTRENQDRVAQYNAAFNLLSESLQTLYDYRDYNQNPDGTSQQRDRVFSLPAGTMYSIIGGNANNAFKTAGIWYLSDTLPQNDQEEFRNAVNNNDQFIPSSPTDNLYADIFLSDKPAHEFRRIGRRVLIEQVQDSPEYERLEDTEFVSDILFYTNRYQTIYNGLRVIERRVSDFPAGVQNDVQNILNNSKKTVAGMVQLGNNLTNIESSRTVNTIKDDLFSVIDHVRDSQTINSINQVLGAASDIERAVLEILEGDSVAYNSFIPSELTLDNVDADLGALGQVPLNPLRAIFGSDDLLVSAGQDALAGGNIENILVHVGIQKVSEMLSLPKEAMYLFYQGDRTADNLFYSIGVSRSHDRSLDRESLIDLGRAYVTSNTVTSLAQKLGVKTPDWLTSDDIANFIIGDPVKTLVGMGGRKLEQTLDLPADFFNQVIYPEGETEALRSEQRQRTIISATLGKLDIELNIPEGFTLTSNPVTSIGQARIESVLGLNRGEFSGTREQIFNGPAELNSLQRRDYQLRIMSAFGIKVSKEAQEVARQMREIEKRMLQISQEMGISHLDAREIFAEENGADRDLYYDLDEYFSLAGQFDSLLAQSVSTAFNGSLADNYFQIRLNGVDRRMGILTEENNGPTKKWIQGEISTEALVGLAGEQGATELGGDAFAAVLERLGVEGQVFDSLIADDSNRNFLISFFKQSSYTPDNLSQVYSILSSAFSFDLDKKIGFEAGTIADLIAQPKEADDILIDQGVRLLAGKAFGINMSNSYANDYDGSINAKRVIQRVLFGALYNADSDRFELTDVNPNRAIVAGLQEFRDIAGQYIQEQIGADIWPYFQAPVNAVLAIADLNINALATKDNYVGLASAAGTAITRAQEGADANTETNRITGAIAFKSHSAATNGAKGTPKEVKKAVALAAKNGAEVSTTNQRTTESTNEQLAKNADEQATDQPLNENEPDSEVTQTGISANFDTSQGLTEADLTAAQNRATQSGAQHNATKSAQLVAQTSFEYISKEFGYASMDFGLSQLLKQPGLVTPGLSRTLFEGTPEERTNAIAYIGSNVLARQFRADLDNEGLGWLVEQQTISAVLEMFQGNSANVNQLLTEQGLARLTSLEGKLFNTPLFKDLGLANGTLAGLVGFALNGNDSTFSISGVEVKGLSDLYNTDWLLGRAFALGEKWLGIEAGKLAKTYQLSYNFYKSYKAYNDAIKLKQGAEKISALKAQMVNAAIELGIYVVDLVFGKEIAKIEQSLGLPPGTITGALSLILTAVIIGTGPMFWASLAIFVLVTIFGFGKTRITTASTADGYYPFVGKAGQFSPPFDPNTGNVPYSQWPAPETLNTVGQLKGTYFGEFDPTNESQKIRGFKDAARGKVINLVADLFRGEEYGSTTYTAPFYPTQVLIHKINEAPDEDNQVETVESSLTNRDLYQEDKRYADIIYSLNLRYFPGACNSNAFAEPENNGICTSPDFYNVVHIGW